MERRRFKKGFEFLPAHFNPQDGRRPRRNLVGPAGMGKKQARLELNAWVKWLLTSLSLEYFRKTGANPKYVTMRRAPIDQFHERRRPVRSSTQGRRHFVPSSIG